MTICHYCDQAMSGDGCTQPVYDDFSDGTPRERIVFVPVEGGPPRCRDCNAAPGHLHHPGCCIEECPGCHGQAISCGCATTTEDS